MFPRSIMAEAGFLIAAALLYQLGHLAIEDPAPLQARHTAMSSPSTHSMETAGLSVAVERSNLSLRNYGENSCAVLL